jgi:aspartate aminotransferase
MNYIAQRIENLEISMTVALASKAQEFKARGEDIISLAAGEPDFNTPSEICEAAKKFIETGAVKYTAPQGIRELRQAVSRKFREDNGLDYSPDGIVVSSGAKQALYNAVMCTINPGDEVVIPLPCWVSYPEIVKLAGGRPVFLKTREEHGFRVPLSDLEKLDTGRLKALILCTPNNPTGAVCSREDLEGIARWAVKNDILIIADEIYEKILYGDSEHCSIGSLSPDILKRTITINGLSKSSAMTGWRLGYMGADPEIAGAAARLQAQSTHAPSTVSQQAALTALAPGNRWEKNMVESFSARRRAGLKALGSIPGVSCFAPGGAFYLFPNFAKYYNKKYRDRSIKDSNDLCSYLLEEGRVVCVPGSAFGDDRFIRISYACDIKSLEQALERIKQAVAPLN